MMNLKNRNYSENNNDFQEASTENDKSRWFDEISDDPAEFELAPEEVVVALKEEARKCLNSEIIYYNTKNTKSNSDYRWMKTATQKGTSSDKVAASTLLIQDNPIANLELLRNLVSMVKVSKKKECIIVIDTLTELFLTSLLKPNTKLKLFYQRPLLLLGHISSGNARTRQKYLTYWYFEDQLKEVYTNFVLALNKAAHDTLDTNKEKAIGAMHKLLSGNPEQEKVLLINILNKLGDPSQKVASKVIYCLNQLLFKHINMQSVVLNELEKLLFRTNIGQKAQYYGICFLSQFYLSHESADIAKKLIEVYFSFFKACVKKGEVDSRMMSALLMGVNRAYPYAKLELQKISEHIDTMYRVVHVANFNVSLHALMLLYQVSDYANNVNNRFYSALYKKLNDPKLLITTHQAMFLNLVYKSLMKDTDTSRIKAFIKRLLQVTLFMQPPFACGVLYLISQLMSNKPGLQAIKLEEIDNLEISKFEVNEEEKYNDVVDSTTIKIEDEDGEDTTPVENTNNITEDEKEQKPDVEILNASMKEGSSWYHCAAILKQEKKDPTAYDPFNRNPLYAGADHSAYLELIKLTHHYHPTVSLYAEKILEGTGITYSGDPLKDFSLIRFLDRFVFKNPKKIISADGSHPTFGIRKKYKPSGLRSLALNSEKYLKIKEKNIPVDEIFLYKYMQTKVNDHKIEADDSDVESVASEEFEEMLDKMTGSKVEDDLDYMNEIGDNLVKNNKKSKKLDDPNESDVGSDAEDMDEDDEDFSDGESEKSDDIEPDEEDILLTEDLDDDDMDEIVFDSDVHNSKAKNIKKLKKRADINSVFASAEEFALLLDDEGSNSKMAGSSNALSNKDNAATKQIAWEEKRNHWLQGYNKAVGKKSVNKNEFKRKHSNKSKFNTKSKKRKH